MKRLFDLTFAMIGLCCLSPFIFLFALAVMIESRGPGFYKGVRVGHNGKTFRIYKLRTMIVDSERANIFSTANDDPRITRIGKFLRKHKLDELPQLINVLIGDMSLVGPRPEVQSFADIYTNEEKQILTIPPGITDWASLWDSDEGSLLKGSSDPDRDYRENIRPEKIRLQLKYVQDRSFRTDMQILFLTMKKLFSK